MAILSFSNSDRLYWLGRYSERVYTTLRFFARHFDSMIDLKPEEYADFCKKQDIPNIYTSKEDFSRRYCFDENDPNSIFSNLMRAYDNAIVLREEIGSETLAYIQLAVYAMNKAKVSEAPLLELQKVVDNIAAFWGMADDRIDERNVRSIIKLGKRVERIDLYARMNASPDEIRREIRRLSARVPQTGLRYSTSVIVHLNYMAEKAELDYPTIVREVESLIDFTEIKPVMGF